MKRILAIFKRDIISSLREFMLIYMMVAPILLAIGLRFFIPSVGSASIKFAVDNSVDKDIINIFNRYGNVERYDSVEDVKKRVNSIDDIAGVIVDEENNFKLILEGNESHDTEEIPKKIIRSIKYEDGLSTGHSITDIGVKNSPIATIGTTSLIIMAIVMGGIVIGLNIIEEKESGTIRSLIVSPMSKIEFILGKSVIGVILPIIQVYIILWILGMSNVNIYMVLILTLISMLLTITMGFLIGVISGNQIAGIANLKLLFLIVSLSIIGAIMLPQSKQFLLYWAPPYWSFIGFRDILLHNITWYQLFIYCLWILGLSTIIFMLVRKKINNRLS